MNRGQQVVLTAGGLVLAFAIGFGWQYTRARELEQELAEAEAQLGEARAELTFARLESTLAAGTVQAQRGSFEVARGLASEFYTGLQQSVAEAPAEALAELQAILAQRDAMITALSRADPASGELLAQLLVRYRVALGGAAEATPIPAPAQPAAPAGAAAPDTGA